MTTVDLAPDESRIGSPTTVLVDRLGPCDRDDCPATCRVTITWQPREKFGQANVCLNHVVPALETALDDSPDDSQIHVEYLWLRTASAALAA